MKKFFFFAAAAMTMLASCHKNDLVPDQNLEDNSPVAIKLGMNAPSITVTKTKAAVDDWNNNTVYVYGLKQERTDGAVNAFGTMYNLSADTQTAKNPNIVGTDLKGYKVEDVTATGENGNVATLDFYQKNAAGQDVPYYYSDGQTYDFFGYHLGGAVQGTVTAAADVVSFPVTFNGSNDVMYAYAAKAKDLENFRPKGGENGTVADLYSSWAVRRNVQPTLVFNHALTRFNFIVKGQNAKANTVQIQKIEAETVTSGTLTVVGQLPGTVNATSVVGFAPDAVVEDELEPEYVTLLNANDQAIDPTFVTANTENVPYGGARSSLMVAPNMAALPIVVTMKNQVSAAEGETPAVWSEPYTYEFSALAANVVKDGNSANITNFAPGTAYNIYINVYGPEEIVVTAELVDWVEGGDFTYDPDDAFRPGSTTSAVTASYNVEASAEAGKNVWDVTVASDVTKAFAGVSASADVQPTAWEEIVLNPVEPTTFATKSEVTTKTVQVAFNTADGNFLHIKYTKAVDATTADDCKNAEVFEIEVPEVEFEVYKAWLITDEASYRELPEGYTSRVGCSWESYMEVVNCLAGEEDCADASDNHEHSGFQPLPWLAVKFTPGPAVATITYEGDVLFDHSWDSELGLLTRSASQLGFEEGLPGGDYIVTVNGIENTITVPITEE